MSMIESLMRFPGISILLVMTASCAQDSAFVTIAAEPANYAWYLRARFHPAESTVRGVAIVDIDSSWCAADEFKRELFPEDTFSKGGKDLLDESGLAFSLSDKFDGDRLLTAVAGVYQRCNGKIGNFIMVVDPSLQGVRTLVFVEQLERSAAFAALRSDKPGAIQLWFCMACDDMMTFAWSGRDKRFIVVPHRGDDEASE